MPLRILLLKPQIVNIGNGFIAKGARALLETAFPKAEIIESSAFSYYLSDLAVENGGDEQLRRNTVGVSEFVDVDAAVLPGCVLYPQPLRRHLPLFKSLSSSSVPVFIIGGGGNDYKQGTKRKVRDLLDEGRVKALISRDISAYEAYGDTVTDAFEGIDCAFYIDDWFEPSSADSDFVTATFDKVREPDIETNDKIIRPHHAPFNLVRDVYEGNGFLGRALKLGRQFTGQDELETAYDELRKGNLFVSDDIQDYLFIYANANSIHADRIHACVPGLVYGNKIKFYYETPRGRLFDGLVNELEDGYETLDRDVLSNRKKEQIQRTIELFEKHC